MKDRGEIMKKFLRKIILGLVVIIMLFAISSCAKKPVAEKPVEEVTITEETPEEITEEVTTTEEETEVTEETIEVTEETTEEATVFGFGEIRTVKPKKLTIYLTDQEQLWFPWIAGETVLYSMGNSFDEDEENYNLSLHVEPSIIKDRGESFLSQEVDWHFFNSLYLLTHPEGEKALNMQDWESFKLFTKYREKEESTFFEIKKQ